ncbi:GNAT family N-acetyltransferase [Rhizobium sp. P32RR-XVIII]|uniref:GNAT family N-acetyltransferase n=1 Tax=Rhizobium sp. P32RR-XVIII TaxID=2726738 RepID=UPI00145781CC|nr:GNAT family N-acetyltransferase [Rhizobium sp. P32RR-XVIII]NLS05061.1 GNAT family N-acetyltransferase [Rhizobium sp. P32RR-XVIII]
MEQRAVDCHFTQSFDWCRLGWEERVFETGDKLHVATVWRADELIAVWPFIQRRRGAVLRIDPVSCGLNEEYGDPLFAPGEDTPETCAALLRALTSGIDIMHVPFLRDGSNIQKAIQARKALKFAVPIDAFAIDRQTAANFDALIAGYPKKLRVNLRSARKRLGELGEVSFELPDGARDQSETIDWILQQKRAWLQRKDKSRDWFLKEETQQFLQRAAAARNVVGRLGLFVLKLDGTPVAAVVSTIDRRRIEMHVTTFDPAYARFSPGMLLIEDMARWCFERNLSFDMRTLKADYKERWATSSSKRVSYFAAVSARGMAHFAPDLVKFTLISWLEAHLQPRYLTWLKTSIKRFLHLVGR